MCQVNATAKMTYNGFSDRFSFFRNFATSMKKQLLLVSLLCVSGLVSAQDSTRVISNEGKSDLLIDPVYVILGPVLNVSYERFLNKDYGLGLHALLGLGALNTEAQISPYIRMYMGQHHTNGFFLEAFLPFTIDREYTGWSYRPEIHHTTAGFGVGLGAKWVVKNSMVVQVGGGVARRFFYDGPNEPITGKFMFGVGYRFK